MKIGGESTGALLYLGLFEPSTNHSFVNDALDCPPLFLDLPGHLIVLLVAS